MRGPGTERIEAGDQHELSGPSERIEFRVSHVPGRPARRVRFGLLSCSTRRVSPHETSRARAVGAPALVLLLSLSFGLVTGCSTREADPLADARALRQDREFGPALEAFAEAVEADPADPRVNLEYGDLLLRMRLPSRAIWALRRAAETDGFEDAERARMLLATAHFQSSNHPLALAELDALLEANPDHLAARLMRARARIQNHREEEALADIDDLLDVIAEGGAATLEAGLDGPVAPGSGRTSDAEASEAIEGDDLSSQEIALLEMKVKALLKLELELEAESVISDLREQVDPEAEPARAARLCALDGNFAMERQLIDRAREIFESCLETFPTESVVLQKATAFFDAQSEPERSTEILRAALEQAPDQFALRRVFAARLTALGEPAEARAVIEAGRETHPREAGVLLAEHHLDREEFAEALAAFEAGFEAEDDDALFARLPEEYRFMLGDLFVLAGEDDRLRALVETLEEPAYRDFLIARMHVERGRLEEGLRHFDRGFRLWPASPGARFIAGETATRVGDFDAAVDHYRAALRADPKLSRSGYELARLYATFGNTTAAISALYHHTKAHPRDAEAVRLLADLYAASGQFGHAVEIRSHLESLSGQRDFAYADHIRDLATYASPADALRFASENLSDLQDPAWRESVAVWADVMRVSGRLEEALTFLRSSVPGSPGFADRRTVSGQLLAQVGRHDEARIEFEAALAEDPDAWRAELGRARLLGLRGEIAAAVAAYDRAIAQSDAPWVPLFESGALLAFGSSETGPIDVEAGRARFRRALEARPIFGAPALALTRLAVREGDDSDAAMAMARRAARLMPGIDSTLLAAELQVRRGEAAAAKRSLDWAIAEGASGGHVLALLGDAELALGHESAAREAYARALREPFEGTSRVEDALRRLGVPDAASASARDVNGGAAESPPVSG